MFLSLHSCAHIRVQWPLNMQLLFGRKLLSHSATDIRKEQVLTGNNLKMPLARTDIWWISSIELPTSYYSYNCQILRCPAVLASIYYLTIRTSENVLQFSYVHFAKAN